MERMMQNNIRTMLSETREYMVAEGFEDPELETRLLAEHIFGNDFHIHRAVNNQELAHFNEHIGQLRLKIPIQRQIGYTIVKNKLINITSDVLLPGPEIVVLLDAFFDYANNSLKRVVDLCTGCGVLASIIGERFPNIEIYATDISKKALEVARANVRSLNAEFLRGDLFEPLDKKGIYGVDVLISNPPYCKTKDIARLPRQIRDHTPRIAIDGGKDGYFLHRRIIAGASKYLKSNGVIILENEAGQSPMLTKMLNESGYKIECVRKNIKGEERVVVARRVM